MHQPRPHGTFGAEAGEDAAAAELLARRLTNLKGVSGLDSLKMVRTLPSGAIAIAQDAGGVFRVIVREAHRGTEELARSEGAGLYIPALFSGVIKRALLAEGQKVEIDLTTQCRRRLSGYPEQRGPIPPAPKVPKNVKLDRFRIPYNVRASEFNPKDPGGNFHTQYVAQRPTWYSGAMAEVIQIVGGYGRQDLDELPEDKIERAGFAVPEHIGEKIIAQIGHKGLPGYIGLPPESGEFQYDYKFNNTNGVGFDSDKKPWLLRISSAGVYAMPLPLVPATTAKAFREYIEELDDTEILWILDRFGGMPSGENMPENSKDFEAWRRAGVIIKVCDVADFYFNSPYSSACGWAFNSTGTEAFNTCHGYDDDGAGFGLAYKISMKFGAVKYDGSLADDFYALSDERREELNEYMSFLFRNLVDGSIKNRAIKYKLLRSAQDVHSRMGALKTSHLSIEAEIEYWDNLEVEPIATHSGSISLVARGALIHRGKPKYQPQIKFPEPLVGYCVSHDFAPLEGHKIPAGGILKCDTIMYGYYAVDQLKVVKYFLDQHKISVTDDNDFDGCMTVGSWSGVKTEGSVTLRGNFYTTDFDARDVVADSETKTRIVGTALGFTPPAFEYDGFFQRAGTLSRSREFRHDSVTDSTSGNDLNVAVCIPYYARSALLYAKKTFSAKHVHTETTTAGAVSDPYSYRYWTHDFLFAWKGGVTGPQASVGKRPENGNPVWVVQENYAPGECSGFADNGPWIPGLPADYTWLIHPNQNEWLQSGGGKPLTFYPGKGSDNKANYTKIGSAAGDVSTSVWRWVANMKVMPSELYFLMSPDEHVGGFYKDATYIVAGNTVFGNISELESEGSSRRKSFGYTQIADNKSAHHFIGVINE